MFQVRETIGYFDVWRGLQISVLRHTISYSLYHQKSYISYTIVGDRMAYHN